MMHETPVWVLGDKSEAQSWRAVKSVPLSAVREFDWAGDDEGERRADALGVYRTVPMVYRAVDMRAKAVSSMPFALYRGETDVTAAAEFRSITRFMRRLLYITEASLCLYGASYLSRETNRVRKNLSPRWLMPSSVTPLYSEAEGVTGFTRRLPSGRDIKLKKEQVVYFWAPALDKEDGPGTAPVEVAMAAAGVLFNLDEFAAGYFKRGIIKATLLTVEGSPSAAEMEKLQTWWKRMLAGVKKAFQSVAIRASVKPVVIGDSLKDTQAPELTEQKREDVGMALGIPHTLLFSKAGNFATAKQDDMHFYTKTVRPECEFIAEALNEQLFEPLGVRFEFEPHKLEIFQAAELEKAQAIMAVVGKPVLTMNEGRELLGYAPLAPDEVPPRLEGMLVADVETGVVTKNERRARLGLEPVPEDLSETTRRQLLAQLAIVKAAKDAGLGAQEGIALALGEPLESLVVEETEPAAGGMQQAVEPNGQADAANGANGGAEPPGGAGQAAADAAGAADGEAAGQASTDGTQALDTAGKSVKAEATEDDGDLGERMGIERAGAREIGAALGGQLEAVLRGDLTDAEGAAGRIEEGTDDLRSAVYGTLTAAAVAGIQSAARRLAAQGLAVDWTEVNTAALAWAQSYSYALVADLNETSLGLLRQAIADWIAAGEPLDKLIARLTPHFGRDRAELIAATEVTRAFAEGNVRLWGQSRVVGQKEWRTAADERVCPICGGLDGKRVGLNEAFEGGVAGPPAHPRCRCWIAPVVSSP